MKIRLGDLKRLIRETAGQFPTWDELSKKEQLLSTYSDVYKEKYGIRPRSSLSAMATWSEEEIEKELNDLMDTPGDDYDWEPAPSEFDFPPLEGTVSPEEAMSTDPLEDLPSRQGMGRRS